MSSTETAIKLLEAGCFKSDTPAFLLSAAVR